MSAQEHLNGQLFAGSIKGGTPQLFSTKEMLTDRARYPRGFTPDRLREVQATTRLNPQREYPPRAAAVAGVRNTLARSTASVEQMRGVKWYAGADMQNHGGAAGLYYGARQPGFGEGNRAILVGKGHEHGGTPIHELGHHVSEMTGTEHTEYLRPDQQGREEAFAENFAEAHWRDRRGRPAVKNRIQAHAWTSHGEYDAAGAGEFQAHFNEKRHESPAVQQRLAAIRAKELQAMGQHPLHPEGHVPGQLPLLEGDMAGTGGDERVRWDYTDEQRAAGLKRETDEAHLSPQATKLRAERLGGVPLRDVRRAIRW